MEALHSIDILMIAAYFAVIVAAGIHFARKAAGVEDFFLAGRRLGWVTIGFSLFASNISSATLIGLSGAAYYTGISISNYEWMAAIILVFFAIFYIPHYLNSEVFTMPEFLERRFGGAVRSYFSVMTIVGNLFIDTAGTLFAGALVIRFFFPEIELWQSALVLAVLSGLYTAAGGLSAVVHTDMIQAIILLLGSAVITLMAMLHAGSWAAVTAQTPPEILSLIRPASDPTMPWPGLLIGVPILGFYFWCTNQFIVQRVLGAKDIRHARWGALFAGFLKLTVLFIMVFPGVMARVIFPDLETPDLVFPTLVSELLPVGMKGLVLAGLMAAIMSSIDSTLHSASTLVSIDFVKKFWPAISPARLTTVGRVTTIIFMLVAAFWTPVIAQFETLFNYLQEALSYLVPPVVAVFLLGMFWRRANATGAMACLVGTHIISVLFLTAKISVETFPKIQFLYLAAGFFFVGVVVMVIASLLSAKPDEKQVQENSWSSERMKEIESKIPSGPWYLDYRWHSAALLLLTAWMIIWYR